MIWLPILLVVACLSTLGGLVAHLIQSWRMRAVAILQHAVLLVFLAAQLRGQPVLHWQLLGVGLWLLLVVGPRCLEGLIRGALGSGQFRLAGIWSRLLQLLVPGAASAVECEVVSGLGRVHAGDRDGAARRFGTALARVRSMSERRLLTSALVQACVAAHAWDLAVEVYESADVELDLTSPLLAYDLVRAYSQLGRVGPALAAQRVLERVTRPQAAETVLLGRLCLAAHFGGTAQVIGQLERQRAVLGPLAPVLEPYWIAVAHQRSGDPDRARAWLDMAAQRAAAEPGLGAALARRTAQMPEPSPSATPEAAVVALLESGRTLEPAPPPEPLPAPPPYAPPRLTQALLLANVLLFAIVGAPEALAHVGLQLDLPDAHHEVLIVFGALVKPWVTDGQYWRLLSATFLHVNLLHIGLNGVALWMLGNFVEAHYGRARMLSAYVLCGLSGSIASVVWARDYPLSAGASGAICGLLGLCIALCLRHPRLLPRGPRRELLSSLIGSVVLMAALGWYIAQIDNAGHVGGGVAGLLLGLLMYPARLGRRPRWARRLTALVCACAVAALAWSGWMTVRNIGAGGYPLVLPPMTEARLVDEGVRLAVPRLWVDRPSGARRGGPPGKARVEPWRYNPAAVRVYSRDTLDAEELGWVVVLRDWGRGAGLSEDDWSSQTLGGVRCRTLRRDLGAVEILYCCWETRGRAVVAVFQVPSVRRYWGLIGAMVASVEPLPVPSDG